MIVFKQYIVNQPIIKIGLGKQENIQNLNDFGYGALTSDMSATEQTRGSWRSLWSLLSCIHDLSFWGMLSVH